jgi:L-cysteine:1D-myo-inositol 2-amino-2-deoxy-alpha-D-glucopyranoside ligase
MRSWPSPEIPALPGSGVPLSLYDTADDVVRPVATDWPSGEVGVYVCGITPYDSTHLGHAATYVTFDLVNRQLTDNGHAVHYVQNITDVDDPLFERAERDGVDWRELGASQIDLFRGDMEALSVIPPREYVGAMETIDEVVDLVGRLIDAGAAYRLDEDGYPDVYADYTATEQFGYESRYDAATMAELFAERGGDPDRPGKRHPLDVCD